MAGLGLEQRARAASAHQQRALLIPGLGQIGKAKKTLCSQIDRLTTFDDRRSDVGRQEGAAQHATVVGSIDLVRFGGVADASAGSIGERC